MIRLSSYITSGLGLFFSICTQVNAQEAYRTNILRDDIKTLQIRVADEFISTPYIELNGDKQIEINFDALHHVDERFAYSIIHCNADWKKSTLTPIEYMRGFQQVSIDDYATSFNTTTHYANYNLRLPNENVQLLVSGNYVVRVFNEDDPDEIALTACFSVVEPLVEIDASVSGNTDIDFNKEHQQVAFTINQKHINIAYPQTDLKLFVYRNNNRNDVRSNLTPTAITNRQLQYRHNRNLIFKAGNEYRRIEFLTHRYSGRGVETTDFYDPYYHVTLYPETKRAGKAYLYEPDQNGRFFVNCSECREPNTEADYYVVHFSLASERMSDGHLYILGDLFHNRLNEDSRMEYNAETGAYEKIALLKSGLYNYQYVFAADGDAQSTFDRTEGDFFETENEYTIIVYYRPMGARFDRLIGYKNIRFP
jgi:hypothetical protein